MHDPPGVSLESVRQATTWPQWAAASVLGVGMGLGLLHPTVARMVDLASPVPIVLLLGFPAVSAVFCALAERLFREPRLGWLAPVFMVYTVAACASAGACARPPLSVAYAFTLLLPAGWGSLFPGHVAVVTSLVAVPPLLRAATVPGATPRSVAVAAGVGAVTAAIFWVLSLRFRAQQRAEARRVARLALGAASSDAAADRWTALRLHDGLSGALMLARVRVAAGAPGAAETARAAARHARALCGGGDGAARGAPADAAALAAELGAFAGSVGLAARLDVAGAGVDASVWRELREILLETLGNHGRHGDERALAVRVRARRGGVQVRVAAAGRTPLGGAAGRGRRNLELRVAALGGRVRWDTRPDGWVMRLELPGAEPERRFPLSAWIVEALLLSSLPVLGWAGTGSVVVTAVFGAVAALMTAMVVRNLSEDERHRDERVAAVRAEIDAAAPRAVALVREALLPLVERLEAALAAGDGEGTRVAVAALAGRLEDLLWALEHRGDPAAFAGLEDFARRLGVAAPARAPEPAPTADLLYGLRQSLRAAVSADRASRA
jgi:hypothetical protein